MIVKIYSPAKGKFQVIIVDEPRERKGEVIFTGNRCELNQFTKDYKHIEKYYYETQKEKVV